MNTPELAGQITIGALAGRTGLAVSAIRYYEEVGLIPPAVRRPSGHRVYDRAAQEVLALVRHCRDFGFSIEETRALVSLAGSQERDCAEARDIARVHLKAIRKKLVELHALEHRLAGFVDACDNGCAGGPAPQCTIFSDLSLDKPALPAASSCCG